MVVAVDDGIGGQAGGQRNRVVNQDVKDLRKTYENLVPVMHRPRTHVSTCNSATVLPTLFMHRD